MEEPPRPRQAACLVCRRSKIKCDWQPFEDRCKKCIQLDADKRTGLDKALFQIRQAVKRAQDGTHKTSEDDQVLAHLQSLLGDAGTDGAASSSHRPGSSVLADTPDSVDDEVNSDDDDEAADQIGPLNVAGLTQRSQGDLVIDDAENPLQLLARASYIQPSPDSRYGRSPQSVQISSVTGRDDPGSDLDAFFLPGRAHLDVFEDGDPVSLGLVSEEEADSLFTFFHQRLAHTRWGLDPRLYTAEFTRSRSSFLFTSIMAASALFMPSCAALSKRLSNHAKTLAHRVMTRRFRSVEIVLAFLVNIPWMFPGKQSMDDETCTYMAMASTMAIDLSLHKSVAPTDRFQSSGSVGVARADYLDPRAALSIDGFLEVDPRSEKGRLLLRSRERCWIALFVLERGMSLARGRPFSVPITQSLKECDNWHRSDLADPQDGPLVSMAVLRRDLDGLFATVRALCDGSCNPSSDGSLVAQSIQSAIERFFDQWFTEWGFAIGTGPERRFPPYVEILVTHTRLSIYGGVINHPTAPLEVRRFFHAAGLSSALNVMRVSIQGEAQLQSMPNNTAIMVSFAACFALTLSAHATGDSVLAPSVRNLIEEAAIVLIRIGKVTKHRNGLSVLYGKYLKQIVKRAAIANAATNNPSETPQMQEGENLSIQNALLDQQDPALWPETFQFSTMSNDQIQQILNEPGNDLEPSFGGLSWEDMTNFDWLSWPEIGI
ncbi:Satratoxin biosynthesis SC1 cluster transcription factor SAT9 [Paramyrothecium foliicola]|nr:Satratoxin biosynthesis SC1 cluster transcription factor SAT9 [Paramyrothecium foliicola]